MSFFRFACIDKQTNHTQKYTVTFDSFRLACGCRCLSVRVQQPILCSHSAPHAAYQQQRLTCNISGATLTNYRSDKVASSWQCNCNAFSHNCNAFSRNCNAFSIRICSWAWRNSRVSRSCRVSRRHNHCDASARHI